MKILLLILVTISSCSCASYQISRLYVTWNVNFEDTEFYMTANLSDLADIENCWLSIGINNRHGMYGANAVVCRKSPDETWVKHYLNGFSDSSIFDENDPTLGLSQTKVEINGDNLTCKFTRKNLLNHKNYFEINYTSSYYIIHAGNNGNTILISIFLYYF